METNRQDDLHRNTHTWLIVCNCEVIVRTTVIGEDHCVCPDRQTVLRWRISERTHTHHLTLSQKQQTGSFPNSTLTLFFLFQTLHLQLLPARCEGTSQEQDSSRRLGIPGVFLCPRQLPQCLHLGLVLLHGCGAASVQPVHGAAVHSGGQQELWWFLEPSAVPSQELQHLLPGYEQSQWGEY